MLPTGAYRDEAMLTTAANNALAASTAVREGAEATARNGNLTLTSAVKYPGSALPQDRPSAG